MDRRLLLLLLPVALVLPACTDDDSPTIGDGSGDVTTTTAEDDTSTSTLPGDDTTSSTGPTGTSPPGPGIAMSGPSGSTGNLRFTLSTERSEFCYRIAITGTAAATEAHVHRLTGEDVLTLTPPGADGTVETCAASDQLLIQELREAPDRFYVDVHTPDGLIRGNLG